MSFAFSNGMRTGSVKAANSANRRDLEWADLKVMFQYLPAGQPLELKPGASLTFNAKVQ